MTLENATAIGLAPAMFVLRNSMELFTDLATWAAERGDEADAEDLRGVVAAKRERLRVLQEMIANDAV